MIKISSEKLMSSEPNSDETVQKDEIIWFEKTVEYLLLLKHFKEYNLICPLAGDHERAGDVLFKSGTKWGIIEYKRYAPTPDEIDSKDLRKSEAIKFLGPEELLTQLKNNHKSAKVDFHNIIYGKGDKNKLLLAGHKYWDASDGIEMEKVFELGVDYSPNFEDYLKRLVKAKGKKPPKKSPGKSGGDGNGPPDTDPPEDNPPSDGSNEPEDKTAKPDKETNFANVIALTEENEFFCCPLEEFIEHMGLDIPPSGNDQWGGNTPPLLPFHKGGGGATFDFYELRGKIWEASPSVLGPGKITWVQYPLPAFVET